MNVKSVILTILLTAVAVGTYFGLEYKFPNKNEEVRAMQAKARAETQRRDKLLKEIFSSSSHVQPPGGVALEMPGDGMGTETQPTQGEQPSRGDLAKVVAQAAAQAARDTAQTVAAKTAREMLNQSGAQ